MPSCSRSFESPGKSALSNQTIPFSVALLTLTACEKAGRFTVLAGSRQFIAHSMPILLSSGLAQFPATCHSRDRFTLWAPRRAPCLVKTTFDSELCTRDALQRHRALNRGRHPSLPVIDGPFCRESLRYATLRLTADNRIELFRSVFELRKHFERVLRSARQNDLVVDKFQIVIRDNNQMGIHAEEPTDR